jgi:hypothetical protein
MRTKYLNKIACLLAAFSLFTACENEEPMTGIAVDKESLELILGYSGQITVNPVPADIDVDTRTYEWSSDNEEIATVTPFGVVRTVEEGTCNITVKHGTFSQTIPVTVIDPVQVPAKKASWLFDDASDLLKAEIGQKLVYGRRWYNGTNPNPDGGNQVPFDNVTENSTEIPASDVTGFASANGPKTGNGAIRMQPKYFLAAPHGIAPQAGVHDGKVNKWTIMMDIYMPQREGDGVDWRWHALLQTDLANSNDAEVWVRGNNGALGVGTSGYSDASKGLKEKTWYRVVVSANCGASYKIYINGEMVLDASNKGNDARFALDPAGVFFFIEDNRYNIGADIICSGLAMWDVALDDQQVKKLERLENKRY